jgi:hypothetical protein
VRFEKAHEHNADRSVEWWTAWWEKEHARQMKDLREHCEHA